MKNTSNTNTTTQILIKTYNTKNRNKNDSLLRTLLDPSVFTKVTWVLYVENSLL